MNALASLYFEVVTMTNCRDKNSYQAPQTSKSQENFTAIRKLDHNRKKLRPPRVLRKPPEGSFTGEPRETCKSHSGKWTGCQVLATAQFNQESAHRSERLFSPSSRNISLVLIMRYKDHMLRSAISVLTPLHFFNVKWYCIQIMSSNVYPKVAVRFIWYS